MAAERPQTTRAQNPTYAVNPAAALTQGYAAWLGALSPFSDIGARGLSAWRDASAGIADEARTLNQGTQDHLRRFAELQMAMAHKALAAQHPTALAEVSSQWTAASIELASAEARRQGEAMTRMMGAFWPAQPRA